MSHSLVLLLIAVLTVVLKYAKPLASWLRMRVALNKLPTLTETAYPLLGHAHLFASADPTAYFRQFESMCLAAIRQTREKLGVMWFGPFPAIILFHPDAAERLLKSSRHTEKSFIYRFLKPWLKSGLVNSSGEKWNQRRRLLTPTFHFDILEDFLAVMNEQSLVLMEKIEAGRECGCDVEKLFGLCALDIICETAMGCRVGAQQDSNNRYVNAVHKMGSYFDARLRNPFYIMDFFFNNSDLGRDQAKTLKVLHNFTRTVIDDRLNNLNNNNNNNNNNKVPDRCAKKRMALLDVLLHAETDSGKRLSASDIQEEVDTFMFAGHDTNTVTLTWAVYLLGRNPEAQRRLQDELDRVFDGVPTDAPVTADRLRKLTFLDRVIKEVLRMYPPGSFIGRQLSEDCTIDGRVLPKGSEVTLFVYMVHRHPDVWTDPDKFDPDRFDKDSREVAHPYAHIPFSAGPRNCIGQRYALQEQKVILSMFFRRFSVVAHDCEDKLALSAGLVFRTTKPLNLTITRRE